ncbi:MAG: type II toxin-antitoxin system VapC family toxin [Flavobacteriales bacterium]
MIAFLLDTNICIFFNKGIGSVRDHLGSIGFDRCAISEITFAELLYGVERSDAKEKNRRTLEIFLTDISILPIHQALPLFASEKARLRKIGEPIDNFDLLIGATAVHHGLTLVTNNTKHFQRIQGIQLQDWTI